jgi:U4/U6 small nuclear ribonucleoprotein PRP3
MKRSNETESHSALPGKKRSRFDDAANSASSELAPQELSSVAAERAALLALAASKQREFALAQATRLAAAAAAAAAAATSTTTNAASSTTTTTGLATTSSSEVPNLRSSNAPPPLLLDSQGRAIDAKGNLIQEERRVAATASIGTKTASVSVTSSSSTTIAKVNPYLSEPAHGDKAGQSEKVNPYLSQRSSALDSGTINKRLARSARGLQFREAGTIAQSAEDLRQSAARAAQYMATREAGGRSRPIVHHGEEEGVEKNHNDPTVSLVVPDDVSTASPPTSTTNANVAVSSTKQISNLPPKPKGSGVVPSIEWWDAVFLSGPRMAAYNSLFGGPGKKAASSAAGAAPSVSSDASAFSYSELSITHQRSHAFVQHPIPVLPHSSSANVEPAKPPVLMLTKEERKKIRRQVREERNKLLEDQIRMGLIKPPPPKVKISNMMRVLKDAAVADPSLVEARIKAEAAKNIQKSRERNEALKLTPEEREERNKKKMCAHDASGPDCAVYRIGDTWLHDKQARYKVDINAKQLYLSGTALSVRHTDALLGGKGLCLLLVEGGKKAVNKMNSLLMRRINWHRLAQEAAEKAKDDMDTDEEGSDNEEENEDDINDPKNIKSHGAGPGGECELVWRGTVPKRFFVSSSSSSSSSSTSGPDVGNGLRFEECKTTLVARKVLETKGLAHFYDIVAANARLAASSSSSSDSGGGGDVNADMEAAWLLGGAEEGLSSAKARLEKEGFVQKRPEEEEDESMSE